MKASTPTRLRLRLAAVIVELGLTPSEAARRIGVSKQEVHHLMDFDRSPTLRTVDRISRALRVPWERLIEER